MPTLLKLRTTIKAILSKKLFDMRCNRTAAYRWFCASGAGGINMSICAAIISSLGRPNVISKRTNNQLFYSTFG